MQLMCHSRDGAVRGLFVLFRERNEVLLRRTYVTAT